MKEGDTLTELATTVYGYANEDILTLIQKNNPEIKNVNRIEVGHEIHFPRLNVPEKEQIYTVHIASYKPFENARELFQKMILEGYEAYIIPVYDTQKGKLFRVTLGSFKSQQEAGDFASQILEKGVTGYAKTVRLEMR